MTHEPPVDPTDDPLLARLAELPERDVDEVTAQRIRRRAHDELSRARHRVDRRWLRSLSRAYRTAIEPAVVVGVSASYLAWAVVSVLKMYQ